MTEATPHWHDVGVPDDFSEEAGWPVVAGGVGIAVFRQGDALFALRDMCTHGAARLSGGWVENGCVECPLHQGLFNLQTGAACRAPAVVSVRSFPVRVVGGRVEIEVLPTP